MTGPYRSARPPEPCDDLGLDPVECVRRAEEQQRKFAAENEER